MSAPNIRAPLQAPLATFAAFNGLQVAWENVKFTPPAGLYLTFNLMPANTASADLAGLHRAYLGVAQITIMERLDVSTAGAETLARDIAALYPLYSKFDGVMIATPPSIGRGLPDGSRYVLPVSFEYRMDTI